MQAQGGPSRARALGRGTTEVHLSEQNPGWPAGGLPAKTHCVKKKQKKGFLNVARKHFYPPLKFGIMSACWYLVVEEEEKKKQSWRRRSQLLKCALSTERCWSVWVALPWWGWSEAETRLLFLFKEETAKQTVGGTLHCRLSRRLLDAKQIP